MVDAHALVGCGCGRAGSNPASPTIRGKLNQFSRHVIHRVRYQNDRIGMG